MPICFEKRKDTQPNCEHAIVSSVFAIVITVNMMKKNTTNMKDIDEEYDEYDDLYNAPKSFLDKYPLIREYEEECNKRYDRQDEMISVNSRCPLCRS